MNSKSMNIRDLHRGITEFMSGCQHRNNLVKVENSDLLADSHNILNRLKNYYSQLFKVHSASYVRQKGIHTINRLVPYPSLLTLKLLLQSWKSINRQVVIKLEQN
jgi:hypothetical protein